MKLRRRISLLLAILILSLALSPAASAIEKPLTQLQSELTSEGTLPADCSESTLGDFLADAVLEISKILSSQSGEMLVILPARCMTDKLEQGSVFSSDLERVIPEDEALVSVRLSPAQLAELLETGVSHLVRDESERIDADQSGWEGFPQVAGFSWEYDVSAPVGERVQYITVNGSEIDLTDTESRFIVISTADLFDGSLGYPSYESAQPTGIHLRQSAELYCAGLETVSKPDSRSTAIGTASYPITGKIPVLPIAGICIIAALISAIPRLKQKKYYSFEGK